MEKKKKLIEEKEDIQKFQIDLSCCKSKCGPNPNPEKINFFLYLELDHETQQKRFAKLIGR